MMESAIDFSLWGLFIRATLTVKFVMIGLLVMSGFSWAIIINKLISFRQERRLSERFDALFWSGEALDQLYDKIKANPQCASERVFCAGIGEWRQSHKQDGMIITGVQARIERSMDVAIGKESERLQSKLAGLASIGSVAPFIGLFGTVWGIMNAFIEIAEQQNTSLAVVAPGIAEALLATGLGLLAAIPAVVFYNKLASDSDHIIASQEAFADEFSTILSRQLGG